MTNIEKYLVHDKTSCLEALIKLDRLDTYQTLFVIDNNDKLVGTLTDGDIRRGLINGLTLDSPSIQFCFRDFSFISGDISVSAIRKLKEAGKIVFPKLSKDGQIEKIYDLSRIKSILPLHAVIMAGGRGERLRPLTDAVPKPMLLLGNKPIIEHNIDRLISYGIEKITISVRYLSEQIINYFGDGSDKGIVIEYIEETEPLGTIGCLSKINKFEKDILVLNSDVFTNIDFENFYIDFEKNNADMAVATIPYSVDIPYAIMELENNIVKSFLEKPKNTYYANAGIYIIKKENVKFIPDNYFFNATDLMDCIISNNLKLIHSPITGYWIDIGKHDDYNKAKEIIHHI